MESMAGQKVRFREKLGIGSITLSMNLVEQFVSTFFLFYLTDVLTMAPALAGLLITLGRIWDGVNDPLIGLLADNRRFKNGERSRPYALYFCIPLAIFCVVLFTKIDLPDGLQFAYALLIYILFDTLATIIRLPAYALPMLATGNVKERLTINAYVSASASLGGVLASVLLWPIVRAFGGTDAAGQVVDKTRGFMWGAVIIGLIIVVGCLFTYFTTKERVKPIEENEQKLKMFYVLKIMFQNKSWLHNSIFTLFYFSSNIMVTGSIAYYASYVLSNSGGVTLIMGMFALGSLLILPLVSYVSKRFGRRVSMICGASLLIFSKLFIMAFPTALIAAMAHALFMGMSVGLNIVLIGTNRADLVDLLEWSHGRRVENMMNSLSGFISKCGSSAALLLMGFGLQLGGYVANAPTQTSTAINAILAFQGIVPLIFGAIMLVVALVIKLDDEVAQMDQEKIAKGIAV